MPTERPRLTIELFGNFGIFDESGAAITLQGDRPASLLAYLVLHRGKPLQRRQLAFQLWPDSMEGQARTNLRNLLFTLRQSVPLVDSFLATSATELKWDSDGDFALDVAQFEDALKSARKSDTLEKRISFLNTAIDVHKGDLLLGNYDDWVMPIREGSRQAYRVALRQLAVAQEQTGEPRLALYAAQRLLQQDPLEEPVYIELMRLHSAIGDRAGVKRCYEQCAATLRKELDVEPSVSTQEAFKRYWTGSASTGTSSNPSPKAAPAASIIETTIRELPQPTTPFVGRELELDAIEERLRDRSCRLLTIVGMGGMGKTRLAIELANRMYQEFPYGVAFTSLTSLATPDLIPAALADSLQLVLSGPAEPILQVVNFLREKRILLVLDNFEHLLASEEEPVENLLTQLLQGAPSIDVLATSRQRLGLQEEWVFELQGLSSPANESVEAIAESSAVALFLQSARRCTSGFDVKGEDWLLIARICNLVDGMPLGVELAATWTRVLSCSEIVREIESDLDFLSASLRNVPERHRSIQVVFAQSWRLLTPEERSCLARFSVFRGGFSLEAAIKVGLATLPVLAGLVDKSFLRKGRDDRYGLHELVRQYAATRLIESGNEFADTQERHGLYFISCLADLGLIAASGHQAEVLGAYRRDLDNLRLAWNWAVDHEHFTELAAVGWVWWHLCEYCGYFQDGLAQFGQLEAKAESMLLSGSEREQKAALLAYGVARSNQAFFCFRLGRTLESLPMLEHAVELLRKTDSVVDLVDALRSHGSACWFLGEFSVAEKSLREALELTRPIKRDWRVSMICEILGIVLHDLGDFEGARRYLQEGLEVGYYIGDPRAIGYGVAFLSRTEKEFGGMADMMDAIEDGLRRVSEIHDRFCTALCMESLSTCHVERNNPREATRLIDESIQLYRDIGDLWSLARSLNLKGNAALIWNDVGTAESAFQEAATVALVSETKPAALEALLGLAETQHRLGNEETACIWALVVRDHGKTSASVRTRANALELSLSERMNDKVRTQVKARAKGSRFEDLVASIGRS